MSGLTPPGWPRPIVGGWPVPWVSPPDDLSSMDPARKVALLDLRMCQVCGLCHEPGDRVYVCVKVAVDTEGNPTEIPKDAKYVVPMDEGLLHQRCMRLSVKRCPALLEIKAEGRLLVLRLPVDDVFVHEEQQYCRIEHAEFVEV